MIRNRQFEQPLVELVPHLAKEEIFRLFEETYKNTLFNSWYSFQRNGLNIKNEMSENAKMSDLIENENE